MALSNRDCRHGRQIGKCADCDYQRTPTSDEFAAAGINLEK